MNNNLLNKLLFVFLLIISGQSTLLAQATQPQTDLATYIKKIIRSASFQYRCATA